MCVTLGVKEYQLRWPSPVLITGEYMLLMFCLVPEQDILSEYPWETIRQQGWYLNLRKGGGEPLPIRGWSLVPISLYRECPEQARGSTHPAPRLT